VLENPALPRFTATACRRTLSRVPPAQRPTAPAGHRSLSVTDLRPQRSRVDTSFAPANASRVAAAREAAGARGGAAGARSRWRSRSAAPKARPRTG
jgi:hypothetical protein